MGLIYASNDGRWPTDQEFLESVAPELRRVLTTKTTQWSYIWRSFALPWRLLGGRAHVLAGVLEKHWGVSGDINTLPPSPRWFINATCYETGKNWRFSQTRMGDYETNYVMDPAFPIADAIATSAAVPGVIGPLVLRTKKYRWQAFNDTGQTDVEPNTHRYDLWDGGVYDNLGLEALVKVSGGLREGLDFLLISDASARLDFAPRTFKRAIKPAHRTLRLIDVATDQVRAVRARAVVDDFVTGRFPGAYVRIGNSTSAIYKGAKLIPPGFDVLGDDVVDAAATFKTTLRRLNVTEYRQLYRHGYEAADATLSSRHVSHFTARAFDL